MREAWGVCWILWAFYVDRSWLFLVIIHDWTDSWQNQQNGICSWSESSLSAWRKPGSLATHWAHNRLWSDWADSQADLSLGWAYMPFCWFCHEAAHYCYNLRHSEVGFISRIYRNDLKYSDRQVWANSVDPHETAPEGALWSVFTVCHSACIFCILYFMIKNKTKQNKKKKTAHDCSNVRTITAFLRVSDILVCSCVRLLHRLRKRKQIYSLPSSLTDNLMDMCLVSMWYQISKGYFPIL